MYACICRGVTEEQVRDMGGLGIISADELIVLLRLDDERCCGRCVTAIDQFVDLALEGAGQVSRAGARQPSLPRTGD